MINCLHSSKCIPHVHVGTENAKGERAKFWCSGTSEESTSYQFYEVIITPHKRLRYLPGRSRAEFSTRSANHFPYFVRTFQTVFPFQD